MSHSFTLDCSTETLILRKNQTAFIKEELQQTIMIRLKLRSKLTKTHITS